MSAHRHSARNCWGLHNNNIHENAVATHTCATTYIQLVTIVLGLSLPSKEHVVVWRYFYRLIHQIKLYFPFDWQSNFRKFIRGCRPTLVEYWLGIRKSTFDEKSLIQPQSEQKQPNYLINRFRPCVCVCFWVVLHCAYAVRVGVGVECGLLSRVREPYNILLLIFFPIQMSTLFLVDENVEK